MTSRSRRRLCFAICTIFSLYLLVIQYSPRITRSQHPNLSDFAYVVDSQTHINVTALFSPSTSYTPLLRKAFHRSAYNVNVLPYFHRRTVRYDSEDIITLTTWATYDRLDRLVELAELGRGPISIAFFVPLDDESAGAQLIHLHEIIQSNPSIFAHVDIHLVTSSDPLLHNIWRNVARAFATTDWVMLWDIDFAPCTDYQAGFRKFRMESGKKDWVEQLNQGKAALVIPAFEWVEYRTRDICPRDKQDLVQNYQSLSLDAFETDNPVHSHATDYAQFIQSTRNDPYVITDFEFGYEVYAIYKQDIGVWCDERFAGHGFNRAACTAGMYLGGIDFYVLPDQWAFHQNHESGTEGLRDSDRTSLSWATFRMDLCHEAAERLMSKGLLHLEKGHRVLSICKHQGIPGLDSDLDRMIAKSRALRLSK